MGNLRDKYTDEEWDALIKEIDAERAQELKNILTKNTCRCGKVERMETEHYCKKCLGENPLLST